MDSQKKKKKVKWNSINKFLKRNWNTNQIKTQLSKV